jgi:hypothetical protein
MLVLNKKAGGIVNRVDMWRGIMRGADGNMPLPF